MGLVRAIIKPVKFAGAAAFVGMETTHNSINPKQENTFIQNALHFLSSKRFLAPRVSLPLADSTPSVVKAKTGASFPWVISESRRLLGNGLRKKSVLGIEKH